MDTVNTVTWRVALPVLAAAHTDVLENELVQRCESQQEQVLQLQDEKQDLEDRLTKRQKREESATCSQLIGATCEQIMQIELPRVFAEDWKFEADGSTGKMDIRLTNGGFRASIELKQYAHGSTVSAADGRNKFMKDHVCNKYDATALVSSARIAGIPRKDIDRTGRYTHGNQLYIEQDKGSYTLAIIAMFFEQIEHVLSMIIQDVDANIHDFSIVGITPPPLHVTAEERDCIWLIDRFPPIYRIDDVDEARRLGDLEIVEGDVGRANVLGKREDLRWVGSTAIDHLRPIRFTHPYICVALGYQPYRLVHLQCTTDLEYATRLKELYNVMKQADEYAIVGELLAPCWIRTNSSFESSGVDDVYEVRNAQNRKIIIRMIKNTKSRDDVH